MIGRCDAVHSGVALSMVAVLPFSGNGDPASIEENWYLN